MKSRSQHTVSLSLLVLSILCVGWLGFNTASVIAQEKPAPKVETIAEQLTKIEKLKADGKEKSPEYLLAIAKVADTYEKNGNYQASAPYRIEATGLVSGLLGKTSVPYAEALQQAGSALFHSGKQAESEKYFEQGRAIFKLDPVNHFVSELLCEYMLGNLCVNQGRFAEAVTFYDETLKLAPLVLGEKNPVQISMLHGLAAAATSAERFDKAAIAYERAVTMSQLLLGEGSNEYGNSLEYLGVLYVQMRRYRDAIEVLEKAIKQRELVQDHVKLAQTLQRYANALNAEGRMQQAMEAHQRRVELLLKSEGASATYAQALLAHAASVAKLGNMKEAQALFDQGLAVLREKSGKESLEYAEALEQLALIYSGVGDAALSLAVFDESLKIYEQVVGKKSQAYIMALHQYGNILNASEAYPRAVQVLETTLELAQEVFGEEASHTTLIREHLASSARNASDYAKAEKQLRKVLEVRERLNGSDDPAVADALEQLALLLDQTWRNPDARSHLDRALVIKEKTLGKANWSYQTTLTLSGMLHNVEGQRDRANDLLREVAELKRERSGDQHPEYIDALAQLALSQHWNRKSEAAAASCEMGLAALDRMTNDVLPWLPESQQRALLQANRSNLDIALTLGKTIPVEKAMEWVINRQGLAFALQAANKRKELSEKERPEIELSKKRGLRDELEQITSQLASSWLSSTKALSRSEQSELMLRAETIERQLFGDEHGELPGKVSLKQLQDALPENGVFVDYFVYEFSRPFESQDRGGFQSFPRVAAFVLSRHGPPQRIELGYLREIDQEIDRWLQHVRNRSQGANASADGKRIYELLWKPIEQAVGDASLVLITPERSLAKFPFTAIVMGETGKFLLERYSVVILPAPRILIDPSMHNAKDEEGRERNMLLVGDVDYGAFDSAKSSKTNAPAALPRFERLAGTQEEIAAVAQMWLQFQKGTPRQLSGQGATESAFCELAPQFSHLHIATHGFFLADESGLANIFPGIRSGVALSNANRQEPLTENQDGRLTAQEVSLIGLTNTELVTLSACETGLGADAGPEGILGLQRAFHLAGAKTVVASLWNVDDQGTNLLMQKFYENLLDKRMSKSDALRQAQLWMMRHPDELKALGVDVSRGSVRPKMPQEDGTKLDRTTPTSPRLWAAFQLSGDWR